MFSLQFSSSARILPGPPTSYLGCANTQIFFWILQKRDDERTFAGEKSAALEKRSWKKTERKRRLIENKMGMSITSKEI